MLAFLSIGDAFYSGASVRNLVLVSVIAL